MTSRNQDKFKLPNDLYEFLRAKRQLTCKWSTTHTGKITLHSLDKLRIGRVYVAPRGRTDPNYKREGVYRIPTFSLTSSCKHFDPDHLLTYLPFENNYATFDADHAVVTVFPGATWTDIASNPLPYINANWEPKPSVPVRRPSTWHLRYEFFSDSFD